MPNDIESIDRIWDRIELLGRKAKKDLRLRPGAPDEQIAEWQRAINLTLPEDVQASYRRHDGQQPDSGSFIDEWRLLPWQDSVTAWTRLNRIHEPLQPHIWDPHWIPVTMNGLGDHHVLDLSEHGDEKRGRLILLNHETTVRPVIAASFVTWLNDALKLLELDASYPATENLGQPLTPKMSELMGMIGRSPSDLSIRTLLSRVAIERERDGTTVTLRAVKAGFDITCDRENITQIDIYLAPSTGQALYAGELIGGVNSSDNRTALREKLGIPVESDKKSIVAFDANAGWDAYRLDGHRVQFTFRPNWNGLSWITVT